MEFKEITVVLFADLVTGKDDHILWIITIDERDVLIDCISGTFVPVRTGCLLIRRQNMYATVETVKIPRLSVSNVLIQNKWLILGQNTNGINAGVYAVRQREVDNTVFSAERNCRFCKLLS